MSARRAACALALLAAGACDGAPEAALPDAGGDPPNACRFAEPYGPSVWVEASCERMERVPLAEEGSATIESAAPLTIVFAGGTTVRPRSPFAIPIAPGARVWAHVEAGGPLVGGARVLLRDGSARGRLLAAIWDGGEAELAPLGFTFEDEGCAAKTYSCGRVLSRAMIARLGGEEVRIANESEAHVAAYRVINAHAHRYLDPPHLRCSEVDPETAVGAMIAGDLTATAPPPVATTSVAAPADVFREISVAGAHACGLRTDGSITCWWDGAPPDGATVPQGTFEEVVTGPAHTCGRTAAGAAVCTWTTEPGPFTQLAAGDAFACGLLQDGALRCWGPSPPEPRGAGYTRVRASGAIACAVAPTGVTCWSRSGTPRSQPGAFTDVAIGTHRACALTPTGRPTCWNLDRDLCNTAPPGPFTTLALVQDTLLALQPDGTLVSEHATLPRGRFTALSASDPLTCALTPSGHASCWR